MLVVSEIIRWYLHGLITVTLEAFCVKFANVNRDLELEQLK